MTQQQMLKRFCFEQAFGLILRGYKVRATAWSSEYYISFNGENIIFTIAGGRTSIVNLAQLNIWRQVYTSWELYI